ncbi:HAD superfamily hydrolase (TIGR01490 family) [Comamonas sp. BIGb0124]|uniref:histidinol-phosphatase n=1 Tax=Comamonas sp. BIGb0124 TaxID=2485130 RepID=UPI000F495FA7|nr:HAD family hydrolase [Comamonas sp. BIGb0124]ROR20420.1 HAD superfamily hydrolase (TIGR01490 family) [Comamonas sp. BIGb0124]
MRLALFDLDHTLIPLDSDHAWGQYTVRIGWRDAEVFAARNNDFYQQYKDGTLDIHAYVRFATEAVRERGRQAAEAAREGFMRDVIEPALLPQARELLRHHQDAGDRVVIVTATNEFVTRPIATALGVDELIGIRLARGPGADDWISGEIEGVPSFREGKIARVQEWLAQQNLSWESVEHSVFYSDSLNDLALLERVHEPVATNPDDRLRALALARGWTIRDLFA